MAVAKEDFAFVATMIEREAGIVLDESKSYLVDARLAKVVRDAGLATPGDVVARLRNGASSDLKRQVIDAMTTNETLFFRDTVFFGALRTHVIPKLIKARADSKTLRIWCAACSTGQEPYSLAMLMHQHFPVLRTWNVRMLASDISQTVLQTARAGRYNQLEINRGLSSDLLDTYFTKSGEHWTIKDELKKGIEFRQLNLKEAFTGLPQFDLIFVRNVLYYFAQDTRREIVTRMAKLMVPDGLLFVASTESLVGLCDSLGRTLVGGTLAYSLNTSAAKAGGKP